MRQTSNSRDRMSYEIIMQGVRDSRVPSPKWDVYTTPLPPKAQGSLQNTGTVEEDYNRKR